MAGIWLFKSEPDDYSLDDLRADGTVRWDSIRNYGARNRLRRCAPGDRVLFYHSGREPAVVGVAKVVSEAYPDPTQFDESSDYHDPKSDPDDPRWWAVDIEFVRAFDSPVTLQAMKQSSELEGMEVLRQSRLSVSEVQPGELEWILAAT